MDTLGLFTMFVEPPVERYGTAEAQLSFYRRLLDELRGTAGVDAAVIMQQLGPTRFAVESREYATPNDRPAAWLVALSETPSQIGPTLREGRAFDSRDSATGLKTVIVDESLARALWPNESALDRRIEVSIADSAVEQRVVVGVVDTVSYDPFGMTGIGNSATYVPLPQVTVPTARFLIRHSSGSEDHARTALHEALGRVDPTIPPGDVASYTASIERESQAMRTVAKLLLGCGSFAILLTIAGIYGLSSNAVVLRSHEIGLRRALGATNGKVMGLFLAHGVRQLAIGLAASALLSAAVLFMMKRGFNLSGWTLTLMGASIVVAVSATVLLSIYVSVRGVIRREPTAALRCD